MPVGDQTVPDALLGCWRRNWIRFGDDGDLETDVQVIWLQTVSGMADVRIDPKQGPTQTDSSCGITMVEESTRPYMTAEWLDGDSGFSQQTVPSFPEKGWLDWHSDTIMFELAPSGAYVEEWERLPDSGGTIEHHVALDSPTRTNLYLAGHHVILAIERSADQHVHEFSYGVRTGDSTGDTPATIDLSTIAGRIGQPMNLDFDWQLVSKT